jgi:peptidoglycan/LPS O-acetylase OafA/YrhL
LKRFGRLFRIETEDALSQILPKSKGSQDRVPALDLLRLVAALAVVVFHYAYLGAALDGFTKISLPALEPIVKYGWFGVELSFVISGFVIAWSAHRRTAVDFAIARVGRLWPAFAVCTTLTFLMTYFFGAPYFETSFLQWATNLTMLSPAFGQPFMDGSYWSILLEIVFYGWMSLFIALDLFPRRLDEIILGWLAIALTNEALLHSKIINCLFVAGYAGFFCAGILLAEIARGRRGWQAPFLIVVSIVIACGEALSGGRWMANYYSTFIDPNLMIGLTVLVISLVAAASRIKHAPLSENLLLALGGLTYPLYLLHQQAGFIGINKLYPNLPSTALIPVMIFVMIALAYVISRFIEPAGRKFVIGVLYAIVKLVTPPVKRFGRMANAYAVDWVSGVPLRSK